MKNKLFSKLFLALILSTPFVTFASFTITPVELEIDKDKKSGSLTITNNNEEEKSFQLLVYKADKQEGQDPVHTETKDLILTPVMFKIAPGKSQLIRVAVGDKVMYSVDSKGYVLAVQELPHTLVKEGSHVQLVTKFTVPVTITSKN